jgi:CheY-like chemotaxis protein
MPTAACTVLHIDDNVIDRMIVREIFAEHAPDVRVVMAGTAAEAMPLARVERPDVILLEAHLPDGSGEQLLARLARDPKVASIPVVVVTADDRDATRRVLHRAGAYGYLTKPVDVAKLLGLIASVRREAAA